jgi:hypothetical protein
MVVSGSAPLVVFVAVIKALNDRVISAGVIEETAVKSKLPTVEAGRIVSAPGAGPSAPRAVAAARDTKVNATMSGPLADLVAGAAVAAGVDFTAKCDFADVDLDGGGS